MHDGKYTTLQQLFKEGKHGERLASARRWHGYVLPAGSRPAARPGNTGTKKAPVFD